MKKKKKKKKKKPAQEGERGAEVGAAAKPGGSEGSALRLSVSNLPPSTTTKDLDGLFRGYGGTNAQLAPGNTATVDFASQEQTERVIADAPESEWPDGSWKPVSIRPFDASAAAAPRATAGPGEAAPAATAPPAAAAPPAQLTDLERRALKAATDVLLRGFSDCARLQQRKVVDFLDRLSDQLAKMVSHLPAGMKDSIMHEFVEQAGWDPKEKRIVRMPLKIDGVTSCLGNCLGIVGADVPSRAIEPSSPQEDSRFSRPSFQDARPGLPPRPPPRPPGCRSQKTPPSRRA